MSDGHADRTPAKIRWVERLAPPEVSEEKPASAADVVTNIAAAAPRATPRRTRESGARRPNRIGSLGRTLRRAPPDVQHREQGEQERGENDGQLVHQGRAQPENQPAELRQHSS